MRRVVRGGGWTLVELITVIVIVGVLSGGAGVLLVEAVKAWHQFTLRADTGMQARLGMDWMVREIRETDVDSLGAPLITTASATTYDFTHALEGATNEAVSFNWSGTAGAALLRGTTTLVPEVTALTLAYYDKNDAALTPLPLTAAQRSQVRRVVMTMTIRNPTYTAHTMKIKGEAILRAPYN